MTREEFAKFAMFIKTVYPRENVLPNEAAMEIWFRMLKHIPFETAMTAIEKWTVDNKWPPTIAEIISKADEITTGELPGWQEAWLEVNRAIGKYGYMEEKNALSSMSELTRKCVEYIGWKNICMSENAVAERANFRNCYETVLRRDKEDRQLPPGLKKTLERLKTGESVNAILGSWQSDHKEKLISDGTKPQDETVVYSTVETV